MKGFIKAKKITGALFVISCPVNAIRTGDSHS